MGDCVILVAVIVIDVIAVIVVFRTYICRYVVLMMVALMFLHHCWRQSHDSRTDIIYVVRQHRRRMYRQQLDGQLPVPAGIPLSPAFRFLRPRAGAGWPESASSWHERWQAMNCPVLASALHVLSLLGP